MSSIERRALEWALSDDTGISSEALAKHMLGLPAGRLWSHPGDGGDFGRCARLLDKIPEWRPRIREMAAVSEMWKALSEHWDELDRLYRADDPGALGRRMRALLTPAEDATGRVVRVGKGASIIFGR